MHLHTIPTPADSTSPERDYPTTLPTTFVTIDIFRVLSFRLALHVGRTLSRTEDPDLDPRATYSKDPVLFSRFRYPRIPSSILCRSTPSLPYRLLDERTACTYVQVRIEQIRTSSPCTKSSDCIGRL